MNTQYFLNFGAEAPFQGEMDYTIALAEQYACLPAGQGPVPHFYRAFTKTVPPEQNAGFDSRILPLNRMQYAKVQPYTAEEFAHFVDGKDGFDGILLASGNSTLNAMLDFKHRLENHFGDKAKIRAGYVSHTVGEEARTLLENDVAIFTPPSVTREFLHSLYKAPDRDYNLQTIPGVPHTYTPTSCRMNYKALFEDSLKEPWGQNKHVAKVRDTLKGWMKNKKPFAIVVVNAGFEKNGKWRPYTTHEAFKHALAFGRFMKKMHKDDTQLYIVEGGPRNHLDFEDFARIDKTSDTFNIGFECGQGPYMNKGLCLIDPFIKDSHYNPTKVACELANHPLCRALITNAEGYSLMDGAVQTVNNRRKNFILGAIPFKALKTSRDRVDNIAHYNQLGFDMMYVGKDDSAIFQRPKNQQVTPIVQPNAVKSILGYFGIQVPDTPDIKTQMRENFLPTGLKRIGRLLHLNEMK